MIVCGWTLGIVWPERHTCSVFQSSPCPLLMRQRHQFYLPLILRSSISMISRCAAASSTKSGALSRRLGVLERVINMRNQTSRSWLWHCGSGAEEKELEWVLPTDFVKQKREVIIPSALRGFRLLIPASYGIPPGHVRREEKIELVRRSCPVLKNIKLMHVLPSRLKGQRSFLCTKDHCLTHTRYSTHFYCAAFQ